MDLIIGGDSLIGGKLANYFDNKNKHYVSTTRKINKNDSLYLDLNKIDKLEFSLDGFEVAYVFAGVNGNVQCNLIKESNLINVELTYKLIKKLVEKNIFVVYLSTNQIFSENHIYHEHEHEDKYSPINEYGRQKSEIEKLLRKNIKKIAILRVDKVLDKSKDPIKSWISNFDVSGAISAPSNLYFRPVSADYLVESISLIAKKKESGIFHLRGETFLSYYDLCKLLFERCNFNTDKLSQSHINIASFNPHDVYPELSMWHTRKITGITEESLESLIYNLSKE
jgi:dTDP-4-dehydrorhamnose reductase